MSPQQRICSDSITEKLLQQLHLQEAMMQAIVLLMLTQAGVDPATLVNAKSITIIIRVGAKIINK